MSRHRYASIGRAARLCRFFAAALALVLALGAATAAAATHQKPFQPSEAPVTAPPTVGGVPGNVLILSTDGNELTEFMEAALKARGVPHEVVRWSSAARAATPGGLEALLYAAAPAPAPVPGGGGGGSKKNRTGRFAGVVMVPDLEGTGGLTRAEVGAVARYQRRTGARLAKFNAWPTSGLGFEPDQAACSSAPAAMALAPEAATALRGLPEASALPPLNASGLYRCPGVLGGAIGQCNLFAANFAQRGIISKCTAVPLLTVAIDPSQRKPLPPCPPGTTTTTGGAAADGAKQPAGGRRLLLAAGGSARMLKQLPQAAAAKAAAAPAAAAAPGATKGVAAALITHADGREAMAFTFDCGAWSPTCQALANLTASWLLQPRAPPAPVDEAALAAQAAAEAAAPDEAPLDDADVAGKWACVPQVAAAPVPAAAAAPAVAAPAAVVAPAAAPAAAAAAKPAAGGAAEPMRTPALAAPAATAGPLSGSKAADSSSIADAVTSSPTTATTAATTTTATTTSSSTSSSGSFDGGDLLSLKWQLLMRHFLPLLRAGGSGGGVANGSGVDGA